MVMRRMLGLCRRPPVTRTRHHATARQTLTAEEIERVNQPLPPKELLRQIRSKDRASKNADDESITIPGDSFGIMHNRTPFYKPVPRPQRTGLGSEWFPEGLPPHEYLNQATLERMCERYKLSPEVVINVFRECEGNMNLVMHTLLQTKRIASTPRGSFNLVAMESYVPETFCFINFELPSYEATQDEEVLESIHELVLSAAEIPGDTSTKELLRTFQTWTTEDGRTCGEVMEAHDIRATDMIMLPHGEYSVQGYYMTHPLDALGFPNVGMGAVACCLDLRTGIHNRFRFHVERTADSVSEHILNELVHIGQQDHVLRQPFWMNPEYSVEEFIRYKENVLQPSAAIYEMRYCAMLAASYGISSHRNIVEMEKLRVAQYKYEKNYENITTPSSFMTTDGTNYQSSAAAYGGATTQGAYLHRESGSHTDKDMGMTARTKYLADMMSESMQRHGDFVMKKFYTNNFF